MDMKVIANSVLQHIGGKENIVSATHCATRLRLVLKDDSKVMQTEIENIEGVKGAFSTVSNIKLFLNWTCEQGI